MSFFAVRRRSSSSGCCWLDEVCPVFLIRNELSMELRKEDCENRFQIETLEEWIAPTADETACAPGMDLDGRTDTVVAADARSCSPCPPTIRPHVAPERLVPQPPDAAAVARHPWPRPVAELEAIRPPRTLP